ncbi:MAG: metallophosphoesterase family protein, partial [Luteolibacter sp.]
MKSCCLTLLALSISFLFPAQAVNFTDTYSQDFNAMGTGSAFMTDWSMKNGNGGTDSSTWVTNIPGSGADSVATMVETSGTLTYNNAVEGPSAPNINGYNLRGNSDSDRALGTSPTGASGVAIQLVLTNTRGSAITGLRIGYDIRRYAAVPTIDGNAEMPGYQLFYSLDGGSTWTNVSELNPTLAGAGIQVPNTPGTTNVPLTSINLVSNWNPASDLLLRWVDDNAEPTSPDQMYGLDNVAIQEINYAPPTSGSLTRGPYLNLANQESIVVRWRSSQSIAGRVRYGTSSNNLNQSADEAIPKTDHEIKLTGLTPYTRYYYSVGSANDTLTPEAAETTSFTPGAPAPTAEDYTFRTSPLPGAAVNARIWIVGDCGRGSQVQASGRDAYYSFNGSPCYTGNRIPDLNLQLGDNAYESGSDEEYGIGYFSMYSNIFRKMPQWSCLGNHETNDSTSSSENFPYFDMFTFPTAGECGGAASGTERYYSFNYGNIHFICLDSQTSNTEVDNPATTGVNEDGPMASWLRADLAANTATWTIAFWHHPPYSRGSVNSDYTEQSITMRTHFNPILEDGGVDLLYFGHSHNYERSVLLDGHYGDSASITSTMKKNAGNGSISGFTTGASGTIRNAANEFTATSTVDGAVIPGDGSYVKPLTGPHDHFGAVYNTAGMSGTADFTQIDYPGMYICYNTVGTVNLDVNGNTLTSTFVQTGGATPDNFTITKQGAADTDGDGISDAYEIAYGLNRYVNDAASSADSDSLSNFLEFAFGLNPNINDGG